MEGLLPDPNKDRMVNVIVPPPQHPISHNILFPDNKKRGSLEVPDWLALKEHLLKEGRMRKVDLIQLIRDVMEIMSKNYSIPIWYLCITIYNQVIITQIIRILL